MNDAKPSRDETEVGLSPTMKRIMAENDFELASRRVRLAEQEYRIAQVHYERACEEENEAAGTR